MKKFLVASLMTLMSLTNAMAQDGDLVLQGEKWIASFKNYNCVAFGPAVAQPKAHADLKVVFEKITTDSTLDNGLIKATFEVDGKTCRYNAVVFADNAAATMTLVDSKAYAPAQDADCAAGKEILDQNLTSNNYLYWGHPHNLSVMVPSADAEAICGAGATAYGINFVVTGRIQ